ncbi:hypothetical protein AV530_007740 [Patagioenas fasciata monilis]|uniref:Uncharacterized protein n=1 Tax=Patagioenas fasciata monilis TaxID=372326 RepID=A0A1V4JYY1_PATFA|nr:hypothetical protein AV530_007740 [Patagioenas fasciata monilis]
MPCYPVSVNCIANFLRWWLYYLENAGLILYLTQLRKPPFPLVLANGCSVLFDTTVSPVIGSTGTTGNSRVSLPVVCFFAGNEDLYCSCSYRIHELLPTINSVLCSPWATA